MLEIHLFYKAFLVIGVLDFWCRYDINKSSWIKLLNFWEWLSKESSPPKLRQ